MRESSITFGLIVIAGVSLMQLASCYREWRSANEAAFCAAMGMEIKERSSETFSCFDDHGMVTFHKRRLP